MLFQGNCYLHRLCTSVDKMTLDARTWEVTKSRLEMAREKAESSKVESDKALEHVLQEKEKVEGARKLLEKENGILADSLQEAQRKVKEIESEFFQTQMDSC